MTTTSVPDGSLVGGSDAPGSGSGSELADRVTAAVLRVPGVAGMHAGTSGEVATCLPGRKVEGVRIRGDITEVHVVLVWSSAVLGTADAVRAAVTPLVGTPVDVVIQDIVPKTVTVDASV